MYIRKKQRGIGRAGEGRRAEAEAGQVGQSLRMWEARRLKQKLKLRNSFMIEDFTRLWAWTGKGSVGC